jgi:hypothetical protein
MAWKDLAAGLGTEAALSGLKAAKDQMGKGRYKRLIATAVAQLLELHPDIGPRKARKRARRVTGARPSKKLLKAAGNLGWKEAAEGAVAAVSAAGVAKVVGAVGSKVKEKLGNPARSAKRRTRTKAAGRQPTRTNRVGADESTSNADAVQGVDEVPAIEGARENPAESPS